MNKEIKTILFSIYNKECLEEFSLLLKGTQVKVLATDGTHKYFNSRNIPATNIADITGVPAIFDGRVKSINHKLIGGIVAEQSEEHLQQMESYGICKIDCVVVDLYPVIETINTTKDIDAVLSNIDIGGVTILRAAAKHYKEVVVISSKNKLSFLKEILAEGQCMTTLEQRADLARETFRNISQYDAAISSFFDEICMV